MSRLIFIIVIIAAVYYLLKSYSKNTPPQKEAPKTQDMVSCAYCGVHLPKSESLQVNGKFYCCEAHSRGQAEA
jgi:uncharacterized protein